MERLLAGKAREVSAVPEPLDRRSHRDLPLELVGASCRLTMDAAAHGGRPVGGGRQNRHQILDFMTIDQIRRRPEFKIQMETSDSLIFQVAAWSSGPTGRNERISLEINVPTSRGTLICERAAVMVLSGDADVKLPFAWTPEMLESTLNFFLEVDAVYGEIKKVVDVQAEKESRPPDQTLHLLDAAIEEFSRNLEPDADVEMAEPEFILIAMTQYKKYARLARLTRRNAGTPAIAVDSAHLPNASESSGGAKAES